MKKLLAIIIVIAVIAAGGFFWKKRSSAATAETGPLPTVTVKRGALRQTVQCTGQVVSNLDVEIKCKASGLIVNMPFDISDRVKKDDLLVEIDPVDQTRGVQQAEAAQAASKAKLAQAKANLSVAESTLYTERKRANAVYVSAQAKRKDTNAKAKREEELLARKQSSAEQAETAETSAIEAEQNLQTAEAQVEALKTLEAQIEVRRQDINLAQAEVDADAIALALANQRLSETKVHAPIDGVISARTVQVGQIIASGINNVGGGTSMLTISDLSHIYVLASVDESDIGNVVLDQPVDITVDAYPRKKFQGLVKRIATKGVNVSNVVTFEVKIEVMSENKTLLKPMMTANTEIIVAERPDTLSVPLRAIVRKEEKTFVNKKLGEGKEELIAVETGLSDGNDVEILKGVQENDTVICQRSEADSRWRADSQGRPRPPASMMMMRPPSGGRR